MPIKTRTKRLLIWTTVVVTCLLLGGFAFVFYFMHTVYETEEILGFEDLPPAVRDSFEQRFPGASQIQWEFDDGLYEAAFHWQGRDGFEASFDPDGTWTKIEIVIAFSDLPGKAQIYLKSQEGYEVKDVVRRQLPGLPVTYEAELESTLMKWDCLFDAEGNLLSRMRDGPVLEHGGTDKSQAGNRSSSPRRQS